jgi:uncharacterized protein with PQ loop repeat
MYFISVMDVINNMQYKQVWSISEILLFHSVMAHTCTLANSINFTLYNTCISCTQKPHSCCNWIIIIVTTPNCTIAIDRVLS